MENILQIADLTKRYPDFYLDHLTLNVPSGSIVGLIGENGAGKTTTMNLILNAVTKDSGDILVFGQDNLSHEKEVKQRIGVVQDECNLPFMFSPADIETIMQELRESLALLPRFPGTEALFIRTDGSYFWSGRAEQLEWLGARKGEA